MDRNIFKTRVLLQEGNDGHKYWDFCDFQGDWCMAFVSYCMLVLAKIDDFPKEISCTRAKNKLKSRINHSYETAEIGDIIFFELNNNSSDGVEHVGIVVDNSNGKITLVEGNTSGSDFRHTSVNVFTYPVNNSSFDCIIDMSSYFENNSDYTQNEFQKLKSKLERIREIVNEE